MLLSAIVKMSPVLRPKKSRARHHLHGNERTLGRPNHDPMTSNLCACFASRLTRKIEGQLHPGSRRTRLFPSKQDTGSADVLCHASVPCALRPNPVAHL